MGSFKDSKFHFAMFPWFAIGHITPYLHLSNKLAERGHKISFLLPKGAKSELENLSLHPHLIHFFPLDLPRVDGLPPGAQTASDVPFHLHTHLATALDQTQNQVEAIFRLDKPDFIFFDCGFYIPTLARDLGIKSVYYAVTCAAGQAVALVPALKVEKNSTPEELVQVPPGHPSPKVQLRGYEAKQALILTKEFGSGLTFFQRLTTIMKECDVIAIRTCREVEGPFCDYIAQQYNKRVLLTGPVLPETPQVKLEEPWAGWLSKFEPKSVVFCALGSQIELEKDQFQEMVLGFELAEQPFLVALKPPQGCATVEEALPEGFKERVQGRGWVEGGWVPQPAILGHESVGCFVSHCGFGSMWESLLSECQLVLVPHIADQIINTRLMVEELKVAVEVERGEQNGWIAKESLCKAIRCVMDEESKMAAELKSNHAKWRKILSAKDIQSGYLDNFIQDLYNLVD